MFFVYVRTCVQLSMSCFLAVVYATDSQDSVEKSILFNYICVLIDVFVSVFETVCVVFVWTESVFFQASLS